MTGWRWLRAWPSGHLHLMRPDPPGVLHKRACDKVSARASTDYPPATKRCPACEPCCRGCGTRRGVCDLLAAVGRECCPSCDHWENLT